MTPIRHILDIFFHFIKKVLKQFAALSLWVINFTRVFYPIYITAGKQFNLYRNHSPHIQFMLENRCANTYISYCHFSFNMPLITLSTAWIPTQLFGWSPTNVWALIPCIYSCHVGVSLSTDCLYNNYITAKHLYKFVSAQV